VITGVSVGSINAFGYSFFGKGEELEAATYMRSLWKKLTNDNIWKWWSKVNKGEGLFKAGLIDNTPLHNYMLQLKTENGALKKGLIVSAVDATSGSFIHNDLSDKMSAE
jgi:predicted acylesterase/phospholipase RssA